ncbi:glycosyltransferase family 8 protein [Thermothielavioides terrestris NRRL 8126]|uniref:Glycosyltransferase family 8 protein n=1 Tax=Thermothielavioides terrestris (strain ATCC 38088 / NRRL 8126) TaxID=578455 RepID=G2RG97_THETT|nr:glycosyltransferase family 8 protein [Thermothielavioides terrestris NRRL 8126]AEO71840.1 glycosyltransferase family 8 protein [Thermothielavioides terrestris NRRL 8126]
MPRAYWLYPQEKKLASHIVLLQPSATEFARVMDAVRDAAPGDYDMEILNRLYGDSALVLPHRPYALLTREYFREPWNHSHYLGSDREQWDPVAVYSEAKYLHFSDWPMPKPWLPADEELRLQVQPKCYVNDGGVESCAERELWNGWRNEFKERRKRVCGTGT